MDTPPLQRHASDSFEQRAAEEMILAVLQKRWRVRFERRPCIDQRVELDGFADRAMPICVEVWAHQGPAKTGQRHKVMADFCKLLLVEKLLKKKCRKVFAVCDAAAIAFLNDSWRGRFAKEVGIEVKVVPLPEGMCRSIRAAQERQRR